MINADCYSEIFSSVTELESLLGDPYQLDNTFNTENTLNDDEQDAFPSGNIACLTEWGFFDYFIPASYGGKLANFDELLYLSRSVARRDLTTAIAVGQTFLGALPVWMSGNDKQKNALVTLLRQGGLGCLALTEKDHGSDIFATSLTATENEEGLLLSGEKWLINNATQGAFLSVLVKKISLNGNIALTTLFLDKSKIGLYKNLNKIKTHGIRGADISGISFNNTLVDKDTELENSEPGMYGILKTLQVSRILCSGFSLGAFDSALRTTLEFALKRKLYNKNIIEIPVVKAQLTRSYAQLLLTDIVALTAAKTISWFPNQLSLYSAACKYYVPVTTEETINQLKVTLGARYFLREEHCLGVFQKLLRDNEVVSLFDGSTQVNLSVISSQLNTLANKLTNYKNTTINNISELFNFKPISDSRPILNASDFGLSNHGQDFVLQSFLHITEDIDHLSDSWISVQPDEVKSYVLLLRMKLMEFIQALTVMQADGKNDPAATARYKLAKDYTHLFAGACCVLFRVYNPDNPAISDNAIFTRMLTICLNNLAEQTEDSEDVNDRIMKKLEQNYQERRLFAILPVKLV